MNRIVAVLTSLVLLVFASTALAQESRGQAEGIKVHGHWVIEVFNSDGTVAARTEFANALDPAAAEDILAPVLSGTSSIESWGVYFGTNLCDLNGNPRNCAILSGTGTDSGWEFFNLQVTPSGGTIVLQGTATASYAGSVDYVSTVTVVTGPQGGEFDFTFANPACTGTGEAGQSILVTVTISFS